MKNGALPKIFESNRPYSESSVVEAKPIYIRRNRGQHNALGDC